MRRTMTFVSTARMFPAKVLLNSRAQLVVRLVSRSPIGEQRRMQILHGIFFSPSHDEMVALLFPFDDGAWANPQPSANFGRDRDLALGSEPGLSERHSTNLAQLPR